MEQLLHDPRSKQLVKDALYDYMYRPTMNYYQGLLAAIIDNNDIITRTTDKCFSYKGELYSYGNGKLPLIKKKLVASLHKRMDVYLAELAALNRTELPYVLGFINQVLNSSVAIRDYISVFPTAIHGPLENMVLTCPCKKGKLSLFTVEKLKKDNSKPISLMKQRLLSNLLL